MDLKRDAEGHLADPAAWSEEVAGALARESGIELGPDHWRVINAVRRFHAETGVSPSMRPLVKLLRADERDLASSIALLQLFPANPARLVARLAGLPKPDNCL